MKRRILVLIFSVIVIALSYQHAPASAGTSHAARVGSAARPQDAPAAHPRLLCPPGVYLNRSAGCSPLGPSEAITRLAEQGLTLPLAPLPAARIDPALGYVPYQYALMQEGAANIYATLDDAIAQSNPARVIGPGDLKYVSYWDVTEVSGQLYFQLRDGTWVSAADGISSRVSLPSGYPGGLTFQRTPINSFGWVIPINDRTPVRREPGYQTEEYTGRTLAQYEVVQVYSAEVIDGNEWYLIGPDEWVEGRLIGRVIPATTPPDGVTNGRWIEINLWDQTIAVYENNQMVYATLGATGIEPFWTQPGLFQVYKKLETGPMSGAFEADASDFYYLQDVPYIMYYDGARALHAAYWRYRLGFPQSHGCVNLSIADAHWLFNWASDGDWVYVWDPSGETPTDPSIYAGGGAP